MDLYRPMQSCTATESGRLPHFPTKETFPSFHHESVLTWTSEGSPGRFHPLPLCLRLLASDSSCLPSACTAARGGHRTECFVCIRVQSSDAGVMRNKSTAVRDVPARPGGNMQHESLYWPTLSTAQQGQGKRPHRLARLFSQVNWIPESCQWHRGERRVTQQTRGLGTEEGTGPGRRRRGCGSPSLAESTVLEARWHESREITSAWPAKLPKMIAVRRPEDGKGCLSRIQKRDPTRPSAPFGRGTFV
ncbi:hypothetical protein BO71DRAFT_184962 [Aspergillus ellipticus CBS 707.79]|uniref:Uncharacterized protein n=1 Tax=Aspergillus ellipticus CBS 707.79 TaxID=1448320 RepID=A0A319CPW4_9EURO|nr:hypothetical protein BO71DRAFT_184962 [Aspergillus ellipticus CBS 707.79]